MQSDLLDVVIGVVFVWFLLSMVLSGAQEGIGWLTHARAKHLWLGIARLKEPTSKLVPRSFLDVVWRLPFAGSLDLRPRTGSGEAAEGRAIADPERRSTRLAPGQQQEADKKARDATRVANRALYEQLVPAVTEIAKEGRLSKLTHLSKDAYSAAVMQVAQSVHPADLDNAAKDLGWSKDHNEWLERHRDDLGDPVTLQALLELAEKDKHPPTADQLTELHAHAAQLLTARDLIAYYRGNPALQAAIARAMQNAGVGDRVAAARSTIETWFEHEMDGLSRLFRRQSRKILILLAIPLVLFTHANTITIFNDLRHDAALRRATVIAATDEVAQSFDEQCNKAAAGDGTTTTTASTTTTADPIAVASQKFACARDAIDRAGEFRVGLAWQDLKDSHGDQGKDADFEVADVVPYLHDALTDDWGALGRALTLIALMFGAQFWYDVLRRLVGLRKTLGNPGGTSPSSPS